MTRFTKMFFAVLLSAWAIHAVSKGHTVATNLSIPEQSNEPTNSKATMQDYNLDFEQGLDHWTKCETCGSAFDSQPIDGSSVRTDRTKVVKVGGDYWRNLHYSTGHHGQYLI